MVPSHLCSVYDKQIKLETIKGYVRAASSFMMLFDGDFADPRFDNPGDGQFGSLLSSLYRHIGKYEKMPERRVLK